MKIIDGKKYEYVGFDSKQQLYQFRSTVTGWNDQELISVTRAVYREPNGRRIFYGPNDDEMFWAMYDSCVNEN